MNVTKESLLLYAVTDRAWLSGASLEDRVRDALAGGATFLQLREKDLPDGEFLALALRIKKIAAEFGVPFVINDNVGVALKSGADGVHIGQRDTDAREVRALLGRDKILGVSVQTAEQALKARQDGADYIGAGAVFATGTKGDAETIGLDGLREIAASAALPVVAIGGLNKDTIPLLKGLGANGAAVVSAIFAQKDPKAAAKELYLIAKEAFR